MNGLIKNGAVRRCWIARHGTDPAGQEMNVMNGDQQSEGDRELGYVCLRKGTRRIRHTFQLRTTRRAKLSKPHNPVLGTSHIRHVLSQRDPVA